MRKVTCIIHIVSLLILFFHSHKINANTTSINIHIDNIENASVLHKERATRL